MYKFTIAFYKMLQLEFNSSVMIVEVDYILLVLYHHDIKIHKKKKKRLIEKDRFPSRTLMDLVAKASLQTHFMLFYSHREIKPGQEVGF